MIPRRSALPSRRPRFSSLSVSYAESGHFPFESVEDGNYGRVLGNVWHVAESPDTQVMLARAGIRKHVDRGSSVAPRRGHVIRSHWFGKTRWQLE